MNILKGKDKMPKYQSHYNAMSAKTKDFIQKICYKKTASVDMTQYGFVKECKTRPVNLLLRPLREQIEKICGKPTNHIDAKKPAASKKSLRGISSRPTRRFLPMMRKNQPQLKETKKVETKRHEKLKIKK